MENIDIIVKQENKMQVGSILKQNSLSLVKTEEHCDSMENIGIKQEKGILHASEYSIVREEPLELIRESDDILEDVTTDIDTEIDKKCKVCSQRLSIKYFSHTQWNMKKKGRCKICLENVHEERLRKKEKKVEQRHMDIERECKGCRKQLKKTKFSQKQWSNDVRQCKMCIEIMKRKECNRCLKQLNKEEFSNKQWNQEDIRQCKMCIEIIKPLPKTDIERECTGCLNHLRKREFSHTQWCKEKRRCKMCIPAQWDENSDNEEDELVTTALKKEIEKEAKALFPKNQKLCTACRNCMELFKFSTSQLKRDDIVCIECVESGRTTTPVPSSRLRSSTRNHLTGLEFESQKRKNQEYLKALKKRKFQEKKR